ncbi:MAG: flippase-like domain-containing protein [Flavobacteriales bacterium]|nr:flippase-like domain-containing protein [Flavobacteriales bacterium]
MTENPKALKIFSPTRIAITILIGLGAASYLVAKDFDIKHFENISWSWNSTLWILIAILMIAIRDLAYMVRIRILTEGKISWRHSFDTIMLWEFASAITPSVVGGSGVAIYIVNKEGISLGRSTAVVLSSAFLDELFYIIMVPIIILCVGVSNLFPIEMQKEVFGVVLGTKGIFIGGYCFILFLTSFISYAIFFQPRGFKWILLRIFKLPFLKKWRASAAATGDEIIVTSKELRHKPVSFWLKAFAATFASWTARFWVVNFIILAFISVDNHLLVYARQLVMWVIMLISPTPGGTGIAEIAFEGFLEDFIPLGLAATLALIWRFISYYPYLFIGAIILPRWIKRTHSTKKD